MLTREQRAIVESLKSSKNVKIIFEDSYNESININISDKTVKYHIALAIQQGYLDENRKHDTDINYNHNKYKGNGRK